MPKNCCLNHVHLFNHLHLRPVWFQALLQTVDREQREMKELDSARDKLLSLCSPGGRDSLTLEVRQLHDLCDSSEQEVRERLTACELRLEELEQQSAKRGQELKERAAALQWELRSLDQALSYSEPQHNITQLQQHWHSLQVPTASLVHSFLFKCLWLKIDASCALCVWDYITSPWFSFHFLFTLLTK